MARSRDPRPAVVLVILALLGCDDEALREQPEPLSVPDGSDLAAVQRWLHSGAYLEWERHDPSPAPGMTGGARVYLAPDLAASLRAGGSSHPGGSVAVREIVDAADPSVMIGWAMIHKVEAATGADAWFFYEVFSTDPDAAPLVAERGAPGCAGCHAEGRDFVLSQLSPD